jgi:uncharacterized linocin/CFP29 family protein
MPTKTGRYTVNEMRNQIFKSGYFINITQKEDSISGFLMAKEMAFWIRNVKNITDMLNKMLDKIAELGISGEYVTKEMFQE